MTKFDLAWAIDRMRKRTARLMPNAPLCGSDGKPLDVGSANDPVTKGDLDLILEHAERLIMPTSRVQSTPEKLKLEVVQLSDGANGLGLFVVIDKEVARQIFSLGTSYGNG
jgi:hypothetical protein